MSKPRFTIAPHILWPGMVVSLLGMSLVACALTVFFALSDPSFAVEKNYYEKALNWDEQAAQLHTNQSLGWTAAAHLSGILSPRGERTLTVTLTDASGQPIENATITADAFHPARSGDRLNVTLVEKNATHTATDRFTRKGIWRIKGTARVGDTVFTFESPAPQDDDPRQAGQTSQSKGND